MSTPCMIGIIGMGDTNVEAIYCHWGGELTKVGLTLLLGYGSANTYGLLKIGNLSSLGYQKPNPVGLEDLIKESVGFAFTAFDPRVDATVRMEHYYPAQQIPYSEYMHKERYNYVYDVGKSQWSCFIEGNQIFLRDYFTDERYYNAVNAKLPDERAPEWSALQEKLKQHRAALCNDSNIAHNLCRGLDYVLGVPYGTYKAEKQWFTGTDGKRIRVYAIYDKVLPGAKRRRCVVKSPNILQAFMTAYSRLKDR